jgi:hypothetical protein
MLKNKLKNFPSTHTFLFVCVCVGRQKILEVWFLKFLKIFFTRENLNLKFS